MDQELLPRALLLSSVINKTANQCLPQKSSTFITLKLPCTPSTIFLRFSILSRFRAPTRNHKKTSSQGQLGRGSNFWPITYINQPQEAIWRTATFTAISSPQTQEKSSQQAAPLPAHAGKAIMFYKCWRYRAADTTLVTVDRLSGLFAVILPFISLAVKGCLLLEVVPHFHTTALCQPLRTSWGQSSAVQSRELWRWAGKLRWFWTPDKTKTQCHHVQLMPANSSRHITGNLTPGHQDHQLSQFKFPKSVNPFQMERHLQ